jgi:hypothetical protein
MAIAAAAIPQMIQAGGQLTDSAHKTNIGLAQLGIGLLMKVKRPKYNIPGAVNERVSMARQAANQQVRPGNDRAVNDISRATSNSIANAQRTSDSSSQILNAAQVANAQRLRALGQNASLNAQFNANARQNLMGVLGDLASFQDKQWNTNVWDVYQQRAATKSALISSGLQNWTNSFSSFNSGAASGASALGGMMGGQGGGAQ